MSADPAGILIIGLVCAAIGFVLGWMGGVAEGRDRERAILAEAGIKEKP